VRLSLPVRFAQGAVVVVLAAACTAGAAPGDTSPSATTLRLGYFPNVTHASAVVGVADGIFADALGDGVTLDTRTFNAGPDVVEAMFSDALDASFIGPNPAINAFTRSNGEAIRIVSGATSGGAFFVVRDGIDDAHDLVGTKIATPQLGNTQDVALRAWLHEQGLTADEQGGGDVSIVPQGNSQTLETFIAGDIDGAWVPEPWATRLIEEGGGHVLVDERELWPNSQYVTTHLIVRTQFLEQHPDVVKDLIEGLVAATDHVNSSPAEAQATVVEAIRQITGSSLSPDILARAWQNLTFTVDPIASSLQESADDARDLGFLPSSDLEGIYDLTLLNSVLREAGRAEIAQP
jgi:NitT/TauT family transport system substrate-binding protein